MPAHPVMLEGPFPGGWTVHVSLDPAAWPFPETCQEFSDWPTARRDALHTACLHGVRYISVLDPDRRVAGDWDWLSNRWRVYALPAGECDYFREPDGPACDGILYVKPNDWPAVRCPRCRCWTGVGAPEMRRPFEVAD